MAETPFPPLRARIPKEIDVKLTAKRMAEVREALDFVVSHSINTTSCELLVSAGRAAENRHKNAPPVELLSELSPDQQKIMKALWLRRTVTEKSLEDELYSAPGTPDRLRVAIERLSAKLLTVRLRSFNLDVQRGNGFVTLKDI